MPINKTDSTSWLKDHQLAALVSELTELATKYRHYQSLREVISSVVKKYLTRKEK